MPHSSPTPAIRLERLVVGYGGRALLPPIDTRMGHGDVWGLIGPNGAGKTTLLRTVIGLLPAVSGTVHWAPCCRVGYVPQRSTLDVNVPARAIDVVRGGLLRGLRFLHPFDAFARRDLVHRVLEETDTARLAKEQFAELSEGQKQRVLMARALVDEPNILILDEPTAAMDQTAEKEVFKLLRVLTRERELTVVFVSHHLLTVGRHASHLLLVDRDRSLVLQGTTAEVAERPEVVQLFGTILQEAERWTD